MAVTPEPVAAKEAEDVVVVVVETNSPDILALVPLLLLPSSPRILSGDTKELDCCTVNKIRANAIFKAAAWVRRDIHHGASFLFDLLGLSVGIFPEPAPLTSSKVKQYNRRFYFGKEQDNFSLV